MPDEDDKNAISLVHDTLECFKYIGGWRDKRRTGEGLETNIVILPDLLLDFRANAIAGAKGRVFVPGGRAGRAFCTLVNLLEDRDEAFECCLFVKTGNLGSLLLDNEFRETPAKRIFEAKARPMIVSRAGEPRLGVRMPDGFSQDLIEQVFDRSADDGIVSTDSSPKSELSVKDMEKHADLRHILSRARTIYLSSVKCPKFHGLFEYVHENSCEGAEVFLDVSRARGRLGSLLQVVSEAKSWYEGKTHACKLAAVFVPFDMEPALLKSAGVHDLVEFTRRYLCPVVSYEKNAVSFLDRGGKRVSVNGGLDLHSEDVPERFKAGVILARAVFSTLATVRAEDKAMRDRLLGRWGGGLAAESWKRALQYGIAVANCQASGYANYCSLGDLLNSAREGYPPFDPDVHVREHAGKCVEFKLPDDLIHDAICLAHSRRQKSWQFNGRVFACAADFQCELGQRGRCPYAPEGKHANGKVIALFDLDGTLINSTEQRRRRLTAAVQVLHDALADDSRWSGTGWKRTLSSCRGENTTEKMVDFFETNVYGNWRFFKRLQGYDHRQAWNQSYWYVTFLVLLRYPAFAKKILDWVSQRKEQELTEEKEDEGFPEEIKSDWADFEEEYAKIRGEQAETVLKAQNAFLSVRMYPFREAFDLLESLRQSGQFQLYVVSEGNPDTQWEKIQNAGLDEFFDRDHVLTTGDAAEPVEELAKLRIAHRKLESERDNLVGDIAQLVQVRASVFDLQDAIVRACDRDGLSDFLGRCRGAIKEAVLGHVEQIGEDIRLCDLRLVEVDRRLKTADFVEKVIHRMAKKEGIPFYSAVLRAILRSPLHPREKLRSFHSLLDPVSPGGKTKFAMVGDRQKKDVEPPLTLLGKDRILTMRLLSDKYAVTEGQDTRVDLQPHYIIETLAQAKLLLLSKQAWKGVHCIGDPCVFHCWITGLGDHPPGIEAGGISQPVDWKYVICGINMVEEEFDIIRQVCCGVLHEHIVGLGSGETRHAFLAKAVEWLERNVSGTIRWAERNRMIALLRAALVETGAVEYLGRETTKEIRHDLERFRRMVAGTTDPRKRELFEPALRIVARVLENE